VSRKQAIIIEESEDGSRCIAIAAECYDELMAFFDESRYNKKLRLFAQQWLANKPLSRQLYEKEAIDEKCDNIYSFKPGKGKENPRIYCQLVHTSKGYAVVLVMGEFVRKKKTTHLSHKEKSAIQRVATSTYELIKPNDHQ
jgi:hypothetical protein